MRRLVTFVLAGGVLLGAEARAQSSFVVRDVRVFDGKRVAERRSVLVENGLIARIGGADLDLSPATEVVDGRGRTLLPGLIDAHVHLTDSAEADLRQALSFGVTTVFDMGSASTRFERIKSVRSADRPDVASVLTAGVVATAPGGHPSQMGGPPFPMIADIAQVTPFVTARFQEGSDYLKIIHDDVAYFGRPLPRLPLETVTALIRQAHAMKKLAVVHVATEADARSAIDAAADGLVHLFAAAAVAPDFGRFVARHRAFVIPTASILHGLCGNPTGPGILADPLLRPYIRPLLRGWMTPEPRRNLAAGACQGTDEAIRQMVRAKATIVAGTDAPSPGQTYGASLHGELALLVNAGLTPTQALIAATSAPAAVFRLADRGQIRPGLRADLVLVTGDPTSDILATRRIEAVWHHGIRAERPSYP